MWQNWLKEISNHLPGSLGYSLEVAIHFFCWHVAYSTVKVVEENVLIILHLAFHSYCYGCFINRLISCNISWPRIEANLWPHANIFRESLHLNRENVCGLWISYSEQSELSSHLNTLAHWSSIIWMCFLWYCLVWWVWISEVATLNNFKHPGICDEASHSQVK